LFTADDATYAHTTVVQWKGTQPIWQVSGNTSVVGMGELHPFRCAGVNYEAGTHPNTVTGEFVGAPGYYKGDAADNPIAAWAVAPDTCTGRGGHLTRTAELAELVLERLPGGSGGFLWNADQAGFDGAQFLAVGIAWTGAVSAFRYYNPIAGG